MTTTSLGLVGAYPDLEQVDAVRDLDRESIHLSVNGVERHQAPSLTAYEAPLLRNFYYRMAMTRAVDLEIVKMSRKGLAFGKHLSQVGNEASAVGAASAARTSDWLALAIRDLGAYISRGVPPVRLLAQACGRTNGLTNGWDGSLHRGAFRNESSAS